MDKTLKSTHPDMEYEDCTGFMKEACSRANNSIHGIIKKLKSPRFVLSISHSNYLEAIGGTEKVLHEEQAALDERGISYVQVYPHIFSTPLDDISFVNQLIGVNVDSKPAGLFTGLHFGLILRLLLKEHALDIAAVHVHHLLNLSVSTVCFLLRATVSVKKRFFLHDYYSICPQVNLLKNGVTYCGGPQGKPENCVGCEFMESQAVHFKAVNKLFSMFDWEFITPSQTAATIWIQNFPSYKESVIVIPHQTMTPLEHKSKHCRQTPLKDINTPIRIAFLGYEAKIKGSEVWCHIISHLPNIDEYKFFHLGSAGLEFNNVTNIPVSFISDGPDAMVKALKKYKIDIAFLWSICPETYSFTVFEAMSAGCFIITGKSSGNIAYQVKKNRCGRIFDNSEHMLKFLQNSKNVRKAVSINPLKGCFFKLKFNTTLAESATGNKHEGSIGQTHWNHTTNMHSSLFKKIVMADAATTHLRRMNGEMRNHPTSSLSSTGQIRFDSIESVDSNATALYHYRNSKLHRMADHIGRLPEKMPVTGTIARKLFHIFWNCMKLCRQVKIYICNSVHSQKK